jgi:peptidoglycan/LPS O-acetylase OafA/YrhL
MMVLVFHFVGQMLPTNWVERAIVGVTKHGLLGVDLFFVLSGFLITGLLYDAHNQAHYLRNFYVRRVLRIFPLYYGVLALVFFVAPLIPLLRGTDARVPAGPPGLGMALRRQHLPRRARGMVFLLPQPLLVALRRGALLPLLALRGCCWRAGRGR